jgi:hypothetical protein
MAHGKIGRAPKKINYLQLIESSLQQFTKKNIHSISTICTTHKMEFVLSYAFKTYRKGYIS